MAAFKDTNFKIRKQGDAELIAIARKVMASPIYPVMNARVEHVHGANFALHPPGKTPQLEPGYEGDAAMTIVTDIVITFEHDLVMRVNRTTDPLRDEVHVVLSPMNALQSQNVPAFKKVEPRIHDFVLQAKREFGAASVAPFPSADPAFVELYARREDDLNRLEKLTQHLMQTMADQATKITRDRETEYAGLKQRLEEGHRTREEARGLEVAQETERLASEAEARKQVLDARAAEIEARAKDLDDRDNRHARRKIHGDLKTKFTERAEKFELTTGTRGMRNVIHVFTWLLLVIFGGGLLASSVEMVRALFGDAAGTVAMVVLLRQVVFALAFSGTAVFYLRWNNAWFEKHAREEFRLKQLELDFDRASWVVEMALEWKEERGTELPPEMLTRLTAGLFSSPDSRDEILHPAEQLAAALLGASAQVELDVPGGRMKLDRKSMAKLARSSEQGPQ